MEKVYTKARAKVNLSLEVLEKREDGYHNIESVFQKINLYDELWIEKTKTNKLEIQTNINELNSQENIIYKAYHILKEKYKNITGVHVILNKKIPMQAGLAGGSTDGASFLLAMNRLFELKLSKTEIETIGKKIGADVIPCFYNQAIMAQGIGDIITPISTTFKYYIIIIKPKMSCDTRQMYQRIDEQNKTMIFHNSKEVIEALEKNKLDLLSRNLYNRFEEVIPNKEIIEKIKKELLQQGAIRKFNDRFRLLCLWNISN